MPRKSIPLQEEAEDEVDEQPLQQPPQQLPSGDDGPQQQQAAAKRSLSASGGEEACTTAAAVADEAAAAADHPMHKRPKFGKLGKDPRVATDFLPDMDRELQEEELRQQLKRVRPPPPL